MIAYVVDTARARNPITFMSNMLYSCSILYRTKLPFFIVFNKIDVVSADFAKQWMNDFEKFQESLEESKSSYMNDLTRSLSLVLESFYEHLNTVAVSSMTGEGFDKILEVIEKCKVEYITDYRPMYEKLIKEKEEAKAQEVTGKLEEMNVTET